MGVGTVAQAIVKNLIFVDDRFLELGLIELYLIFHHCTTMASDQPSAALRGGAEHTRAGVVRAFMLIFAAPALIPAPFIYSNSQKYFQPDVAGQDW